MPFQFWSSMKSSHQYWDLPYICIGSVGGGGGGGWGGSPKNNFCPTPILWALKMHFYIHLHQQQKWGGGAHPTPLNWPYARIWDQLDLRICERKQPALYVNSYVVLASIVKWHRGTFKSLTKRGGGNWEIPENCLYMENSVFVKISENGISICSMGYWEK
jgi:hypothetical protein